MDHSKISLLFTKFYIIASIVSLILWTIFMGWRGPIIWFALTLISKGFTDLILYFYSRKRAK